MVDVQRRDRWLVAEGVRPSTGRGWADLFLNPPTPANADGIRGYELDPFAPVRISLSSNDVILSMDEVLVSGNGTEFAQQPALLFTSTKPQFDGSGGKLARTGTVMASYSADPAAVAASPLQVSFSDASTQNKRDTQVVHTVVPDPNGGVDQISYDGDPVWLALEAVSGYVTNAGSQTAQLGTPGVQLAIGFTIRLIDDSGVSYDSQPGGAPGAAGAKLQVQWTTNGGTMSAVQGVAGDSQGTTVAIDIPVFLTPISDNTGPWCVDAQVLSSIYDSKAPVLDDGSPAGHQSIFSVSNLVYRFLVGRQRTAPVPKRIFRVHPGIGVARVGDADGGASFIGPQDLTFTPEATYKSGGKVLPQAAKFRIWEYRKNDATGRIEPLPAPDGELTLNSPGVIGIDWIVHLANRKASFFQFNGAAGESADASPEGIATPATGLRDTAGAAPFEIDFGARTISNANAVATFEHNIGLNPAIEQFPVYAGGPNMGDPVIPYLGSIQTDAAGALLVTGGRGKADHVDGDPTITLLTYANNPGWYDDISDGPVTATINLQMDGIPDVVRVPVDKAGAAWVLVAPPDFAPGIDSIVSLYDALLDVTVRRLASIPDNPIFDGDVRDLHQDLYVATSLTQHSPRRVFRLSCPDTKTTSSRCSNVRASRLWSTPRPN
jgi:hypothetical protein